MSEKTFEELQRELDELVARLERGDVPLDEALALWERGEALYRACAERLLILRSSGSRSFASARVSSMVTAPRRTG